jgi:hypothetical protein
MNEYANPLMKVNARGRAAPIPRSRFAMVGYPQYDGLPSRQRAASGDASGLESIAADGEPAIAGQPTPRT